MMGKKHIKKGYPLHTHIYEHELKISAEAWDSISQFPEKDLGGKILFFGTSQITGSKAFKDIWDKSTKSNNNGNRNPKT